MCVKKRGKISNGDNLWWDKGVKEAISRKKDAHKAMCRNSTEQNKNMHNCMKNKAYKVASKVMKLKPEE